MDSISYAKCQLITSAGRFSIRTFKSNTAAVARHHDVFSVIVFVKRKAVLHTRRVSELNFRPSERLETIFGGSVILRSIGLYWYLYDIAISTTNEYVVFIGFNG